VYKWKIRKDGERWRADRTTEFGWSQKCARFASWDDAAEWCREDYSLVKLNMSSLNRRRQLIRWLKN
jgi:hypothetical protein